MQTLRFTKEGKYYVSAALADSSNYSVRLSLPAKKRCTVVVQSTLLGDNKPWTNQADYTVYGGEWEKNINGVAPGQRVRLSVSEDPEEAYYQEY